MLQRWATLSALLCSLIGGLILLLEITKVEKEYKEGRGKILEKTPTEARKEVKEETLATKEEKVAVKEEVKSAEVVREPAAQKVEEAPKDTYLPRYNELQGLIENYEINHHLNDLKRLVNIANYLSSKDYKDTAEIYEKYSVIYQQKESERQLAKKKKAKKIGVFAIIALILVAVIVPTSLIVPRITENKRYERIYDEVKELLRNYDDSNYNKILTMIDELEGSEYDKGALRKELNNNHYYTLLVNTIGEYGKNRIYYDTTIEDYLDKISTSFKKVNQIREDFNNLKTYKAYIYTDQSSSADATVWDSEGAQNRTAIRNIYNNANSSGLWNFDYYIQDLAIPYLICNAEFKSGDYSFKWYKGGTDGQINFYMFAPFVPSETDTISFETSFSGAGYKYDSGNEKYANQFQFYLYKITERYDWFRIDKVTFDKTNGKFKCEVFSNVDNSTTTFTEV